MVEYVRGVSGYKTDYDLNINDDTPLHLIAMLHHYNATLDDEWVRQHIALVVKLTDYMLTQRDDHGLVVCRAKGVDLYGISSWRNIIPYYTLDGAVTEINAEAVFALEAAAMLCAVVGDTRSLGKYSAEAQRMREAMMDYLFNDDTGAFVLNYDQDGNYQDNFTADEVFPVLFGIADTSSSASRYSRAAGGRFRNAGRTAHDLNGRRVVLSLVRIRVARRHLAGSDAVVRVALARNGMTDEAVRFLTMTYAAMEGGSPRNTVPGRVRRMVRRRIVEQSRNVSLAVDRRKVSVGGRRNGRRFERLSHQRPPALWRRLRPKGWQWVAAARVHWGGRRCTYVVDLRNDTIYGDMPELSAEEPFKCIYRRARRQR